MSNLPVNFSNNDTNHSTQHNATNSQVNLNSLVGNKQELDFSVNNGSLNVDLGLGNTIHVSTSRNVTLLTFTNVTPGLAGKIYFENASTVNRSVNLSVFKLSVSTQLATFNSLPVGEVIEVEFYTLSDGTLWAPEGAITRTLGGLAPGPIDPSRLDLDITEDNRSEWAEERTEGIWYIAGNEFLPGNNADSLNLGPGYGLNWSFGDTIDSFTSGTTFSRLTFSAAPDGKRVIETNNVYDEDGSYDTSNNQPAGNNSGINVPPSDALRKDSTISQFNANHVPVRIGDGSEVIKIATAFVVEDWMQADDFTTAIFSLEEPNETKTAPVLNQIRNGKLTAFAKNSVAPIDPSDPNPPFDQELVSLTLPATGSWCAIIEELRVDPYGTAGFFNMWQIDATGALVLIDSVNSGWGWTYNDPELNGQFFPVVLQNLQFHEFSPDGIVNNYDGSDAVRKLQTRFVALTRDATVTTEELADHTRFRLELPRG